MEGVGGTGKKNLAAKTELESKVDIIGKGERMKCGFLTFLRHTSADSCQYFHIASHTLVNTQRDNESKTDTSIIISSSSNPLNATYTVISRNWAGVSILGVLLRREVNVDTRAFHLISSGRSHSTACGALQSSDTSITIKWPSLTQDKPPRTSIRL